MFRLETTSNYLGIKIIGDYSDLHRLYDAISNITEIYRHKREKEIAFSDHTEEHKPYLYKKLESSIDSILGLNYDIRHAYQGDRNIEFIDNNVENYGLFAQSMFVFDTTELEEKREQGKNGNVYYSVEILYPWMIYYMLEIMRALESYESIDSLREVIYDYNDILYRQDRAIVDYFVMEVWHCLDNIDLLDDIMDIYEDVDSYCFGSDHFTLYITALCNYLADEKKNDLELRKAILFLILYNLSLECLETQTVKHYKESLTEAKRIVKEKTGKPFLTYNAFLRNWTTFTKNKEHVYEKEAYDFTNRYGIVDWDNIEW